MCCPFRATVSVVLLCSCSSKPALTFLHGLERVVGLDEFDGVRYLFAVQNIVAQTEVRHRQLENLIVPHRVLLEYGSWRKEIQQKPVRKVRDLSSFEFDNGQD